MVRRAPARSGGGDRRSGVDIGAACGHVGVCHHDHGVVERRPGAGVDETERSLSAVWWNGAVVTAT